jgi:quinoprotein glucose dehydrogenase
LLESILHPNRRIAAGYETVVLTLGDGETRAGIVRDEQNGMVRLQTAAEGEFQIPAARIRGRDRAASAMPEGLGELMTRGELRDLIEALSR